MGGASEISSAFPSWDTEGRVCMKCDCGEEAPLLTSWTNDNPGRRFYGCGRFEVEGKRGCGFFKWHDGEINKREKKIIRGLLRRNDEMKIREKFLVGGNVVSWCVILALVVVIVKK